MHRFILEHACLHTNCTVGTRVRHTYIVCTQYIHTHTIVWALTMLENGTSDTCRLIAWSIDVKHYIVRGPFVTASQTTQNNKPKLTKDALHRALLCRLHVLFPINEAVTSSLHSNYSFFCWNNNVIFHWLIYYIYMQNICVVFRVKCEEWQVGCHTYYYYFGRVYRCNFNFNFRQCNMILWS